MILRFLAALQELPEAKELLLLRRLPEVDSSSHLPRRSAPKGSYLEPQNLQNNGLLGSFHRFWAINFTYCWGLGRAPMPQA